MIFTTLKEKRKYSTFCYDHLEIIFILFCLKFIFTIHYYSYEKNWESTYRLTDTTSFYPNHFGPKAEIFLEAHYDTNIPIRYPGHYRQMIAGGKNCKITLHLTFNLGTAGCYVFVTNDLEPNFSE